MFLTHTHIHSEVNRLVGKAAYGLAGSKKDYECACT
jgi:hypothetical protein